MNRYLQLVLFTFAFVIANAQKTYEYPITPRDSTLNVYFDSTIYDPYQWMENPLDPRLGDWIEDQKKISKKQESRQTQMYTLRAQIASMYNDVKEERVKGVVRTKTENKDKYEFDYRYKDYNRAPDLYYRKKGAITYKCLVNIKDFRKEKNDNIIITKLTMNPNQDLIAIGMSHSGSDWREVYFFKLESGEQLTDTLKYLRIGSQIIWYENDVYYDRYDQPLAGRELLDKATGQSLYYHKIGTPQSDDLVLYQNPDKTGTNTFSYFKMDSTRLFFYHYYPSRGKIYKALSYATLNKDISFFLKNFLVYPNNDSVTFTFEDLIGDTVILNTTWEAPNGKLLKADINQVNKTEILVPELDVPLRSANRLGKDKIACIYRNNGIYFVLIFNLKGELLKSIDFPVGKIVKYFYEKNPNAEYTDFCVSSYYHPDIWYQLSLEDLTFKQSEKISVPYDVEDLETRYVKYISKDGTEIPMYITCLKNTKLNGDNPTLLYGYGGYGITVEPNFDQSIVLWLLHGGILATPNIRGGGAEGSDWALSGRRLKKQNTIDDFIAAAEYLIKERFTNPDKLAISGGSHGGLLVGAAMTQRPELFKVVIAEAGAFDMLRFENYTIGSTTTSINEFGTVTNYEDFRIMKSYSPLHNIKKGVVYPDVLLITGDNDDRVPPFHSYKFLATLQEQGSSKSLYQLYLVPGAGHSGALTIEGMVDKMLFEYYFLFDQLDLNFR